jgi:hypothetical protein
MKRALLAPLCLLVLGFAASPAWGGGTASVEITIKMSAPIFHGKVTSSRDECSAKRVVYLYRVKDGPNKLLGTDGTNGQGQWKILEDQFTLKPGVYYAKAPKLNLESGATCLADKSDNVIAAPPR